MNIFENNYKILDDKYNLQYSTKNAIIRHFVNVFKPWRANYIKIGKSITPQRKLMFGLTLNF